MVKRILICSDFLMTKEAEQAKNRDWLFGLLRRPLRRATGLEAVSFSSGGDGFSRDKFFALSGIPFDPAATQFWFDAASIKPESAAYLSEFVGADDFLIGYELSDQTRGLLDRAGAAWIDIWMHPIRFLDDLLFGFASSSEAVYEAMKDFHVKDDVFGLYADRLRIQYGKGFLRRQKSIRPGAALFIGQTLEDKAICDKGRMLSLLDYKEAFEKAGRDCGHVYYSRHPYQREGDEAVLDYVKTRSFAEITDCPAYDLLSSGLIKKVLAISSSILDEARYFGLETETLFKPNLLYGTTFGKEYLSIYQSFVSPHFWARALAPLVRTKACEPVMFLSGKDKLRDMLGYYWSYHHIDKTESLRRACWDLGQRVERLEQDKTAPAEKDKGQK